MGLAGPGGPSLGAALCYIAAMSKLFEQGIEAVKELPPDRQDLAGELLLRLAANRPQYRLTQEQIEDLKKSIAEADRGEFAAEQEIADVWAKFG